jgi:hypothetical protein
MWGAPTADAATVCIVVATLRQLQALDNFLGLFEQKVA